MPCSALPMHGAHAPGGGAEPQRGAWQHVRAAALARRPQRRPSECGASGGCSRVHVAVCALGRVLQVTAGAQAAYTHCAALAEHPPAPSLVAGRSPAHSLWQGAESRQRMHARARPRPHKHEHPYTTAHAPVLLATRCTPRKCKRAPPPGGRWCRPEAVRPTRAATGTGTEEREGVRTCCIACGHSAAQRSAQRAWMDLRGGRHAAALACVPIPSCSSGRQRLRRQHGCGCLGSSPWPAAGPLNGCVVGEGRCSSRACAGADHCRRPCGSHCLRTCSRLLHRRTHIHSTRSLAVGRLQATCCSRGSYTLKAGYAVVYPPAGLLRALSPPRPFIPKCAPRPATPRPSPPTVHCMGIALQHTTRPLPHGARPRPTGRCSQGTAGQVGTRRGGAGWGCA